MLRKRPRLRKVAILLDVYFDVARHATAAVLPQVIQPDPREIYITLTANCNLRCIGCRYGRDFMPGKQLPLSLVRDLLDDCKALSIKNVRLYGGEPLLHKDLVRDCGALRWLGSQHLDNDERNLAQGEGR